MNNIFSYSSPSSWRALSPSRLAAFIAFALILATVAFGTQPAEGAGTVLYRVNAGGVQQDGTPVWSTDTVTSPSAFVMLADQQNNKAKTSTEPFTVDATVPSTVNERIFVSHRHDPPGGDPAQMFWEFPANGPVEVRLFFAETEFTAVGERVFDVRVEGETVLDNFDLVAEVGPRVGTMRSFLVNVSDGTLDLGFFHGTQHTMISGIEIIDWSGNANLSASPNPISLNALQNKDASVTVNVTNDG